MSPTFSPKLFVCLCIFRVLNTFLIQSYFDPDEFWQTMEPAYCTVFRPSDGFKCPGFTWEWKRRDPEATDLLTASLHGPARTYLSVLPTHIFFQILRNLHFDTSWWVARGPMVLYAISVAAPADYAVWYSARLLYSTESSSPSSLFGVPAWCLFASLSSWFNAYAMVRTFANGQETLLLMLSICLVGHELLVNDGDTQGPKSPKVQHRIWRARAAFFLGGMCVAIRGTSVMAYVPMGILLAMKEDSWRAAMHYLFSVCALFGIIGLALAAVVDYWFFGFVTLPFLGNFHFNVILDYASLFGAHPWYWYLTAGIPAISGILLPCLVADLFSVSDWSRGRRNLWVIIATYIFTMSMNDHKEFRYILPILPLCCLLVGKKLQRTLGRGNNAVVRIPGFAIMITGNLLAVLYLGLFHQSGPISANRDILHLAEQSMNPSTDTTVRRVDYWTGACHSQPLLSSLHSSVLRFEVSTLDCSPSCRSDQSLQCETDQFHEDPVAFLEGVYPQNCASSNAGMDETCQSRDGSPSFVVTMSNYVHTIGDYLNEMGLYEIGRYPQNLNGLLLFGFAFGDEFKEDDTVSARRTAPASRRIKMWENIEVSVEEVVLFAHESVAVPASRKDSANPTAGMVP